MKIKTPELSGAALDWAVAKCEYAHVRYWHDGRVQFLHPNTDWTDFKVNWENCGPIIERERLQLTTNQLDPDWEAAFLPDDSYPFEWVSGPTPLIAAMRCYVSSKLGDKVDVPEGLA